VLHFQKFCEEVNKVREIMDFVTDPKPSEESLKALGTGESVDVCMARIEEFDCGFYGHKKLKAVNNARFESFLQHYAPKKKDEPLEKIKGINPFGVPPCRAVLENKIKRANYVATIWKQADLKNPGSTLDPEHCGWEKAEDGYKLKWYDCEQLPKEMLDILQKETTVSPPADEDEDVTYGEYLYGADDSDDEGND
jgi:hypothetical protein